MSESEWNDVVERLVARVDRAASELQRISDTDAARRPAPGKWSRKEIVGHLIDSASNNHQRFVRAHFQGELVFSGYEQDDWVSAERWQDADWRATVTLWRTFNLHLAHVMRTTPSEVRDRVRAKHNLGQIAFKELPAGTPATLGWFMADYVDHLEHHLRQAGVALAPWPQRA
jgi:hypothetical protein